MQIEGVNALVAGGASGLGAATARALGAAGANVTIADLNPERGAQTADEIGCEFIAADVTDPEQVEAAVNAASPLRISVSCAGIGWAEKVAGRNGAHGFEPFETVIRVNLIGTFNVLRLAANAMLANDPDSQGERGVHISTASIAAYDGQIGQAAYSASKGGIVGLTLPAARPRGPERPAGLRRLQGRHRRPPPPARARPRRQRRPRVRDRPRPVRHATARRPPRRGPQRARRPGPVPAPARPPRRVRGPR